MAQSKATSAKAKSAKASASGNGKSDGGKATVKIAAATKSQAHKAAAPKAIASKAPVAAQAKKPNAALATMKKPTSGAMVKPVVVAPKAPPATSKVIPVPKAAATAKSAVAALLKPSPSKVAMPQSSAKKLVPVKPVAVKVAGKPVAAVVTVPVKPTVKAALAPVKPVVAVVKPQAPVVVAAAPAAVVQPTLAKQHVPNGMRPTAQTSFGRPMPPKALAVQPITVAPAAAAVSSEPKKPVASRHGFKTNEWIVYPAQGVGRIVAIEEQEIAGMTLELFVITFEKDKMTLRVPTGKAQTVGMRKLAEDGVVKRAMDTLKGKARIKRTMWSRRAQEFEAKINSGDLVSVAEVVRDLYRAENQPEQSYSERQLYERALDRMAREIAAVDKLDERGAAQKIVEVLSKSAKGRRAAADEAAGLTAAGDDAVEAA
jgi:CarD family transcriptional regulator